MSNVIVMVGSHWNICREHWRTILLTRLTTRSIKDRTPPLTNISLLVCFRKVQLDCSAISCCHVRVFQCHCLPTKQQEAEEIKAMTSFFSKERGSRTNQRTTERKRGKTRYKLKRWPDLELRSELQWLSVCREVSRQNETGRTRGETKKVTRQKE